MIYKPIHPIAPLCYENTCRWTKTTVSGPTNSCYVKNVEEYITVSFVGYVNITYGILCLNTFQGFHGFNTLQITCYYNHII